MNNRNNNGRNTVNNNGRNSGSNNGRNNGNNNGKYGSMGRDALAAKIKALAFAKTETELFLDTHPDSRAALAYYREIIDDLDDLIEEYTDRYGPITASDSTGDTWNWVEGPWPWQRDTDRNTKGDM